jgi:carbonic anhydrase
MRSSIAAFVVMLAALSLPAEPACPPAWGYESENGPDRWGQMDKAWARCDTGKRQSPLDIVDAVPSTGLPDLVPRYGDFPIAVQNTGTEIKVWPLADSALMIGTERATLKEFHFHVPSEHVIDGKGADAELHIVHELPNKLNVAVAVLIKEAPGANPSLQPIVDVVPPNACTSAKADHYGDLTSLLPANLRSYFTYEGSLTTPACDETVTWYVLAETITASANQLERLSIVHGPTGNARPPQPRGKRVIKRR